MSEVSFPFKIIIIDKTLSVEQSHALVKSTFESSSDGILIVDSYNHLVDCNQRFSEIFEIPKTILNTQNGFSLMEFIKEKMERPNIFTDRMLEFRNQHEEINIDIFKLRNGITLECYSQPHKINNKVIGRILDFRDVTKRIALEEKLEYQATHDELTGLVNRVKLLEKMRIAMKVSDVNGTQCGITFIDLDQFKKINDLFSHAAGDQVLQLVARRLEKVVRQCDTVARLGGDEFVIIYTNIHTQAGIEKAIQRLITVFDHPFKVNDQEIGLSASIGVSLYPKDGAFADVLLGHADIAMYRAKAISGTHHQFYS